MTFSITEQRCFSDAIRRLYSAISATEFPQLPMAVIADLIPAENVLLAIPSHKISSDDQASLRSGDVINVMDRPGPISPEDFAARWEVFGNQHPGVSSLKQDLSKDVFMISDFVTRRQFRQTAFYTEILKPFGCADQIGALLTFPDHVVGMAISRDKQFTQKERSLIELLRPHIIQAQIQAELITSTSGKIRMDFRPWRDAGCTKRECEILEWLMDGKRNSEIAILLGIGVRTVDKHLENIYAKMGVENRAAAALFAGELAVNGKFPTAKKSSGPR